jgi:hypothetical protein
MAEIVWEDITGHEGGWEARDKVKIESADVHSIGFLIVDNPDYIVYASDVDENGLTNGRTQVPRANVKYLKIFRKVPSAKKKKEPSPVIVQS